MSTLMQEPTDAQEVRNNWYWIGHTLSQAASKALFNLNVVNPENLVEDGPLLICANHVSYLDPPLVGSCFYEPIWFLGRKTLFTGVGAYLYPKLQCIPVDQENPDANSLRHIVQLLRQGQKVLIFPEGARSESGDIQEPSAGVGLIVAKTGVTVQPVRIFGAHEAFPPGAKFPKLAPVTISVGKPRKFSGPAYKGKAGYQRISSEIMQDIATLQPC